MTQRRMVRWIVAAVVFVILTVSAVQVAMAPKPPQEGFLDTMEGPEVPVDPGPGRGAYVVYDMTTGEIIGRVGYPLANPPIPIPDAGQTTLTVTHDPHLQQMFDDFRSGLYGLEDPYPWFVNLQTLQVEHR